MSVEKERGGERRKDEEKKEIRQGRKLGHQKKKGKRDERKIKRK